MTDVSQTLSAMIPSPSSFRLSQWGRVLALALAGTMLLQSGPVRLLVLQIHSGQAEHVCHRCENGVCPRNPDVPCTCVHSDSGHSETAGVVLRSCKQDQSEALMPMSGPKWQPSEFTGGPAPRISDAAYTHFYPSLSAQRLGDEIFRPPRTTPPVHLS